MHQFLEKWRKPISDSAIVASCEISEAVESCLEGILLMRHIESLNGVSNVSIEQIDLDILLKRQSHCADHIDAFGFTPVQLDVIVGELEHLDLRIILELHVGGQGEHARVYDGNELVENYGLVSYLSLRVLVVQLHEVLQQHLDHGLLCRTEDDVHYQQDYLLVCLLVQVLFQVSREDRHQRFQNLVRVL